MTSLRLTKLAQGIWFYHEHHQHQHQLQTHSIRRVDFHQGIATAPESDGIEDAHLHIFSVALPLPPAARNGVFEVVSHLALSRCRYAPAKRLQASQPSSLAVLPPATANGDNLNMVHRRTQVIRSIITPYCFNYLQYVYDCFPHWVPTSVLTSHKSWTSHSSAKSMSRD